ncbi:MAG: hypothetical protein COB02_02465 [Candidatus Cloacimonadota bacterium]|nr:MAG: hypothetical protein COB02_02465 [Candidatus Cloacimonadota bacterium]
MKNKTFTINISISDEELETLIHKVENHLDIIAWVLKVKNENNFRIRAWLKAKIKLYGLKDRFIELINNKTLSTIEDIGQSIENEIYHFLESDNCSHYLQNLQLDIPQFLLNYKLEYNIRNTLAKANHKIESQSQNEVLFFCLLDYFKSHQILYTQEERKLKDYFYHTIDFDKATLIPSKTLGFYLHSPRLLNSYHTNEQIFLNQVDWLFHPSNYDKNDLQCLIEIPKRHSQFKNISNFEKYHNDHQFPFVDMSLLSHFFTKDFIFSKQFLDSIASRNIAYLLPLENTLYDSLNHTIKMILSHNSNSGFLFSLVSANFLDTSPQILASLMQKFKISEKQILNFSSSKQILKFLQRFS